MKTKFLALTAVIAVAGMLASADSAQAGGHKKKHRKNKNNYSYQQANWNGGNRYYGNGWNNGSCGYYRPVRYYQPCYQPVYYNNCAPRSGFRGFLSVIFGNNGYCR